MIASLEREVLVEQLLNSLEAERYARGALLATLADELVGLGRQSVAAIAQAFLTKVQAGGIDDADFAATVRTLRQTFGSPGAAHERAVSPRQSQ
jgi:hypothetical protein